MELVRGLALASGIDGMVLGQALDIAAETAGRRLTLEEITALQAGKTGALIGFAAEAGAVIAGADRGPLRRYAAALGLAFQIADDILDVVSDTATLGKPAGSDAEQGKNTYPALVGLDESRRLAGEHARRAVDSLAPFAGPDAAFLRALAQYAVSRTN